MVTVLGLLQIACIILGYIALGIVLKIWGYPNNPMVRWAPLAEFLRTQGGWLLLIPLVWSWYAARALRAEGGVFSERWGVFLGVALPILLTAMFLCAACWPCSRVLIMGVSE